MDLADVADLNENPLLNGCSEDEEGLTLGESRTCLMPRSPRCESFCQRAPLRARNQASVETRDCVVDWQLLFE